MKAYRRTDIPAGGAATAGGHSGCRLPVVEDPS